MKQRGMSERHALRVVGMSASTLRYEPRSDGNIKLRQQIVDLAQRYRRYGVPMIYLKLRQAGQRVNHKRVERLYAQENLQVRRHRRKKNPPADRQPLIRLGAAAGRGLCDPRQAIDHPDGQWQGIHRSGHADLGASPRHRPASDRSGQAQPECLPTSNPSMDGYATNASTSTGS